MPEGILDFAKDCLRSSTMLLEITQQDNVQFWGTFGFIVLKQLNSIDDISFLEACLVAIHQKPIAFARERITEVLLEYEQYEIAHALKDL